MNLNEKHMIDNDAPPLNPTATVVIANKPPYKIVLNFH